MDHRDEPRLCAASQKEALEARNGVHQLEYIAELVNRGAKHLRESHVRELQAIAIGDIYPCGGQYRDPVRNAYIEGSAHTPPDPALVQLLVRDAVDWINDEHQERNHSALERAAYALWRFNWIHPFCGGNGRTSRSITYMIVCMDHGSMLPGDITMPTFIKREGDGYIKALQAVDALEKQNPENPDVSPMADFLERMLTKQLASVINKLSKKHR